MEKSTSITNFAKSLIVFHLKVDTIKKDANNPFFKSKYASLSNILEAINEPLIEAGLTFCQFPTGEHSLTTILIHADSGEYMQSSYDMKPVKNDPQGIGSVITYQRRYALSAILGLNIDDDDDGNAASKPATNNGTELPWLNENTAAFAGAVKKIKAGTTTMEKIRTVFKVSTTTANKILEAVNTMP